MERLAVNILVAFALCVLAVTLVLLARAIMGYRTRVTNVWWTRVPFYSPKDLEARLRGRKTLPLGGTPAEVVWRAERRKSGYT